MKTTSGSVLRAQHVPGEDAPVVARLKSAGAILLGKYRVDAVIGRGGMGLVVKAWHLGLDEEVAIKMLRDDIGIADEANCASGADHITRKMMDEVIDENRLARSHRIARPPPTARGRALPRGSGFSGASVNDVIAQVGQTVAQ